MPGACHYPVLIETPEGNLVSGMRRLNQTYTQSFNRRHRQVGHLVQGRYKSIVVDKDSYLLELCRYAVLNPVRAKMVHAARDWRWSSFRATAGLVKAPDWLAADGVLGNFGLDRQKAPLAYRQFVRQGTKASSPWDSLRGQTWLGSDEFSGPTGRVDGQPSCRPATAPAFPATASGESVRAAPRMSRCRHGSRFCRG